MQKEKTFLKALNTFLVQFRLTSMDQVPLDWVHLKTFETLFHTKLAKNQKVQAFTPLIIVYNGLFHPFTSLKLS